MRHGPDGRTLDVGRRARTIPPAIRRALLHRDRTCRFPGCRVPYGQGHHLRHWANGGATSLDNLALLCRRHHRAVHEEAFQLERGADGTLQFFRLDGQRLPDVPTPPAVPADPAAAIQAQHRADGIAIGPRTTCPISGGERFDLGYALDVLRPQPPGSLPPRPLPAAGGTDGVRQDRAGPVLSAYARPCGVAR